MAKETNKIKKAITGSGKKQSVYDGMPSKAVQKRNSARRRLRR